MQLIEDNGLVSLYRGTNDQIIVSYDERFITLEFFTFDYSYRWNPIIVDIYEDPYSNNDGNGNILFLWATTGSGTDGTDSIEWQALSFSNQTGKFVGAFDTGGNFVARGSVDSGYEFTFDNTDQLRAIFGDIYDENIARSFKFTNKNDLQEAVNISIAHEEKALLNYGDIKNWDVSAITDFSNLFEDQTTFNSDISNWDVSNGNDFSSMFNNSEAFDQDLRNWTLNENALLTDMFNGADLLQSNQGVGDTPSIYYFNPFPDKTTLQTAIDEWYYSGSLTTKKLYGDINTWDVSQITDFSGLFKDKTAFNSDISNWVVSNGKDFSGMFDNARAFNQDISGWDVSNGTDFNEMFSFAYDFNQDISGWDVSNGTNFASMFYRAYDFNQDISGWDVSNGTDFSYMLSEAILFNQDISSWEVSNGTDFKWMFSYASVFNQDLGNWDVSNGTNFESMFSGSAINQDISSWDVSNGTDFSYMFFKASDFNQDIGNWDVSKGTNFKRMFALSAFNKDIGSWDVSQGTDFSEMFTNTTDFNQDIGSWDVSSGRDFHSMFSLATNFNQDIRDWDVSEGTNFAYMFNGAEDFNQDISSWYVDKEDNLENMFLEASLMKKNHGVSSTPSFKYFNGSLLDVSNHEVGTSYNLEYIKDYDGNLHANTGSVSEATKTSYKYQGLIDVNADGVKESIYTNKESGRWVTAAINSSGEIDYSDHGSGGTTRVVGIYIDPLVTSGEVEQFGPLDSQRRFQNDLKIDNLIAKTSNDYDGDGFQEVYWKTNDGTAYLRALMHADGNIQYANYQSEDQMSDYLTSKGFESEISNII